MRKQLYLEIQEHLKTIKDDQDQQLFKHFDLWNQNVEFIEQETPWENPAVFIEIMPIDWRTQGNKRQDSNVDIKLHIVTRWFAQTADYSPDQGAALDYLDIPDKVVYAMQNFKTSITGGFTRIQSITNHNHERYVDSIELFRTFLKDDSAQVTLPTQQVGFEINTEFD